VCPHRLWGVQSGGCAGPGARRRGRRRRPLGSGEISRPARVTGPDTQAAWPAPAHRASDTVSGARWDAGSRDMPGPEPAGAVPGRVCVPDSRSRRALPAMPPAAAPGAAPGKVLAPAPVPVPAAAMAAAAAGVPAAAAALAGAPVAALAAARPARAAPAPASRVPAALLDQHQEQGLAPSRRALRRRAPRAHGNDLRAPRDDSQSALCPPLGGRPISSSCALTCACPTSRTRAIYRTLADRHAGVLTGQVF
jgi:hypothetical protein